MGALILVPVSRVANHGFETVISYDILCSQGSVIYLLRNCTFSVFDLLVLLCFMYPFFSVGLFLLFSSLAIQSNSFLSLGHALTDSWIYH